MAVEPVTATQRRPSQWRAQSLTWTALCVLVGCGASLHEVPRGARGEPLGEPLVVSSAPPPAKVEHVPGQPAANCAWLDGQWLWVGQHWEWHGGAWVVPPAGCHYADPELTWAQSADHGVLYFAPGAWYPDEPTGRCQAARTCLATSQGTD